MVLMLDNDFAAVRSCFTDHLFAPLAMRKVNGVASDSFHLTGRTVAIDHSGVGARSTGVIGDKNEMASVVRGQRSAAGDPGLPP